MPVVGDRIQRDVDAAIIVQVQRPRPGRDERHAIAGNTLAGQHVLRVPAMRPLVGEERQPGTLDRYEDPRPDLQHARIDLAEVVQAAEADESLLRGRQGTDRGSALLRIVAPEAVGKPERFLRVAAVEEPRRIEIRVGEAVVDCSQARRAGIAGKCDLHRRRLAGEYQQAVAGHVQGEVNEDVDAVLANPLGQGVVGQFRRVAP